MTNTKKNANASDEVNPYKPDYWRHLGYLDPYDVVNSVTLVGAGAVGSHVTYALCKMGIGQKKPLRVWDFDTVEDHNIPNQVYGQRHIGELKVEALKRHILDCTGVNIDIVPRPYTKEEDKLGGIIVSMVDTIAARKEIFEHNRDFRGATWLLDTRLGIDYGQLYICNMKDKGSQESYAKTLMKTDDQLPEPVCNMRMIMSTNLLMVGLCAHSIVNILREETENLPNFVSMDSRLLQFYSE